MRSCRGRTPRAASTPRHARKGASERNGGPWAAVLIRPELGNRSWRPIEQSRGAQHLSADQLRVRARCPRPRRRDRPRRWGSGVRSSSRGVRRRGTPRPRAAARRRKPEDGCGRHPDNGIPHVCHDIRLEWGDGALGEAASHPLADRSNAASCGASALLRERPIAGLAQAGDRKCHRLGVQDGFSACSSRARPTSTNRTPATPGSTTPWATTPTWTSRSTTTRLVGCRRRKERGS